MTGALLVLALTACDPAHLTEVPVEKRDTLCALQEAKVGTSASPAALEDIYRQPGFEHAGDLESSSFDALLERLRVRLYQWFESTGAARYSNLTRLAVLVLALALALLGLLRVLRRAPRATKTAVTSTTLAAFDDPRTHLTRAQSLLAGSPREALREALFALMATVEAAKLARPDRTWTNRELVAELRARHAPAELQTTVAALVDRYDRAFYSLADVSEADARAFVDAVRPLVPA